MTKENKELLLKDLCARLPYGVMVQCITESARIANASPLTETLNTVLYRYVEENNIELKPYLRSMSSMTEEEKVQLCQYACIGEDLNGEFIDEVQRKDCAAYIDWLNKNHFDYRGLILKGLALEAPEGMYNVNEK